MIAIYDVFCYYFIQFQNISDYQLSLYHTAFGHEPHHFDLRSQPLKGPLFKLCHFLHDLHEPLLVNLGLHLKDYLVHYVHDVVGGVPLFEHLVENRNCLIDVFVIDVPEYLLNRVCAGDVADVYDNLLGDKVFSINPSAPS